MKHYTQSNRYKGWVESVSRRGAQTNINGTEYSSLPVLLPPLPEQRAIAEILDSIDEAIERTAVLIAATEALRESLRHELLSRGIPGWHSEYKEIPRLGTVPADWKVVSLRTLLVLDQPGTWGKAPLSTDPGVPVLRATNLTTKGTISTTKVAQRRLTHRDLHRRMLLDGDIILERSGGGPNRPVGRVALIGGLGLVYCTNFCQQLRLDIALCRPEYGVLALWHRYTQGITARMEHQTTGIHNLDYQAYLSFPIPLPSLPEQRAIATILDSVDSTVEQLKRERDVRGELKQSVAEALLTGRVRVGDGVSK